MSEWDLKRKKLSEALKLKKIRNNPYKIDDLVNSENWIKFFKQKSDKTEQIIIEYLRLYATKDHITNRGLSQKYGISDTYVTKIIRDMKDAKVIPDLRHHINAYWLRTDIKGEGMDKKVLEHRKIYWRSVVRRELKTLSLNQLRELVGQIHLIKRDVI